MNLHVYMLGELDPVKFYDTEASSKYVVQISTNGDLIIRLEDVDKPAIIVAAFATEEWVSVYDVNHDPNA